MLAQQLSRLATCDCEPHYIRVKSSLFYVPVSGVASGRRRRLTRPPAIKERRTDLARWQLSKVKVTVGGEIEQEASRRFVDAWHRAERGESVHERHLAFESWDALARVMTGKRMELPID